MRPDAPALLWDARRAARRVREFLADLSFDDYREDILVKSAVERQFEILGEALNRLSRVDRDVAASVPDLPRIVSFRNILIHGYATVDDAIVWDVATTGLEGLIEVFDELLQEASDAERP